MDLSLSSSEDEGEQVEVDVSDFEDMSDFQDAIVAFSSEDSEEDEEEVDPYAVEDEDDSYVLCSLSFVFCLLSSV